MGISALIADALMLVETFVRLVAVLTELDAAEEVAVLFFKFFCLMMIGCWPRISFLMAPVFLPGSRLRLETLAPMLPMSPRAKREPAARDPAAMVLTAGADASGSS